MNTTTQTHAPVRSSNVSPERVEQRGPTVTPAVDVFENANEILLYADVPGATREGITVNVEKGQLTLLARRVAPTASKSESALSLEYRAYDYYRVFAVPSAIDASKIEAELVAGVLKVKLPKSEALKPRRIDVKAG